MYKNEIMKCLKIVEKEGGCEEAKESSRGCEFDQSTLYACIDI
jgi:hypothetical protein